MIEVSMIWLTSRLLFFLHLSQISNLKHSPATYLRLASMNSKKQPLDNTQKGATGTWVLQSLKIGGMVNIIAYVDTRSDPSVPTRSRRCWLEDYKIRISPVLKGKFNSSTSQFASQSTTQFRRSSRLTSMPAQLCSLTRHAYENTEGWNRAYSNVLIIVNALDTCFPEQVQRERSFDLYLSSPLRSWWLHRGIFPRSNAPSVHGCQTGNHSSGKWYQISSSFQTW